MFKLTLFILALIALSHSQTVWANWNSFAAANPSVVRSYTQPPRPAGMVRYVDTTLTQPTYATRANQYLYHTSGGSQGVCYLYCGLRSFLTTDAAGNVICQRDTRTPFWGSQTGYKSSCIPDVEESFACQLQFPNLIGGCDMTSYQYDNDYKNYECCYDDHNTGGGHFTDLTRRAVATSLYTLRNNEWSFIYLHP